MKLDILSKLTANAKLVSLNMNNFSAAEIQTDFPRTELNIFMLPKS